jgi:transcription antitermination factor NusG
MMEAEMEGGAYRRKEVPPAPVSTMAATPEPTYHPSIVEPTPTELAAIEQEDRDKFDEAIGATEPTPVLDLDPDYPTGTRVRFIAGDHAGMQGVVESVDRDEQGLVYKIRDTRVGKGRKKLVTLPAKEMYQVTKVETAPAPTVEAMVQQLVPPETPALTAEQMRAESARLQKAFEDEEIAKAYQFIATRKDVMSAGSEDDLTRTMETGMALRNRLRSFIDNNFEESAKKTAGDLIVEIAKIEDAAGKEIFRRRATAAPSPEPTGQFKVGDQVMFAGEDSVFVGTVKIVQGMEMRVEDERGRGRVGRVNDSRWSLFTPPPAPSREEIAEQERIRREVAEGDAWERAVIAEQKLKPRIDQMIKIATRIHDTTRAALVETDKAKAMAWMDTATSDIGKLFDLYTSVATDAVLTVPEEERLWKQAKNLNEDAEKEYKAAQAYVDKLAAPRAPAPAPAPAPVPAAPTIDLAAIQALIDAGLEKSKTDIAIALKKEGF